MAANVFLRVGTNIIELKRIRRAARNPKFLAKYFSADEIRFLVSHKLSTELIAENYCAKVAFAKAIGTCFRIIRPQEISILRDRLGSPFIITTGRAKMLEEREKYVFNLSVAHCKQYASATVIINRQ
ncbi:MAG: 4'-phosphopantetheinyl transferase superfamily protein [Oscillospiraceae bacterium]|nr:4'-phosphopantetheinyl transferase superfamily protein [Oscillospiraceae bacterium]